MKKKKVPAILIHMDWIETIKCLSHEQIGKFFVAMLDYANTGNEPEFEDNFMRALFTSFKKQIDRDRKSYEEKCKKNSESAKMRWAKETFLASQFVSYILSLATIFLTGFECWNPKIWKKSSSPKTSYMRFA